MTGRETARDRTSTMLMSCDGTRIRSSANLGVCRYPNCGRLLRARQCILENLLRYISKAFAAVGLLPGDADASLIG